MIKILPNGVAVISDCSHHGVWMANEGLVHDKFTADAVCRHVRAGTVAVDAGAHFGSITLPMLEAGAEVYAFEPNKEAAECLRHNCRGQDKLHVFECGLSNAPSWARLVAPDECALNYGAWHVVPDPDGDVRLLTLDGMMWPDQHGAREVSVLKLDIEGFELLALQGGAEAIARWRPVIICEVNSWALGRTGQTPEQLLGYIESIGYSWSIMQPDRKVGDVQFDVVAIPK